MSLWKLINGRWGSGAGETDEIRIDASTNSLQTIDYAHHEVHGGSLFHCHFKNVVTNANEMTALAWNVPASAKWGHLILVVTATAISEYYFLENPSIDADEGTEVTIYNHNRNSGNGSGMLSIEGTPAAGEMTSYNEAQAADANISFTTELDGDYIGAGKGKSGSGGLSTHDDEWITDESAQYAVVLKALGNDDCYHAIRLDWYEHEDKN